MALGYHVIGVAADDPAVVGGSRARRELRRRYRAARRHAEQRPFDELDGNAPRHAHSLHAQQVHLEPCRLVRERCADERPAVAVSNGHVMARPVAGERLDAVSGDAADRLGPLGRLRHAILLAQHIVFQPVVTDSVRLHVLLLVGALDHPHVGDGQLQGRVGVGQHGKPLICMHGGRVVAVGRDGDVLDAAVIEPVRQLRGELPAPRRCRGLQVAAPVQHSVAVLRDILCRVRGMGVLPDRVHAPRVLGAPVPALPAVGVAGLHGVAPAQFQQPRHAAVRGVHRLALAVAVSLTEDGVRAVLVVDALDLGRDELGGLVPRDAHVLARAARLGVPLALRVPVHALHGMGNAVLRVRAPLVHQREGRRARLHSRLERRAVAPGQRPVVQFFLRVVLVVVHRPDAHELSVLHVGGHHVGATSAGLQT